METKTFISALAGAVLTATIVVSLPETEQKGIYTPTGQIKDGQEIIKISKQICEPFEYQGTRDEIVGYIEKIQENIDTGQYANENTAERIERYKTRFIEDVNEIEKLP